MSDRAALRRSMVAGVLLGCLALLQSPAYAEAGWFETGDVQLRLDLQLLNDAEVIRYPVSQWPIPRAAVEHAMASAKEHFATNSAVISALARVRARVEPRQRALSFEAVARAGEPGMFRDFDTIAREAVELGGGLDYNHGRFSLGLSVVGVGDPADGQEIRADGSHATLQLGNWLLSANTLERWWGPGHESSLILSNNARPMPTLMVERAAAKPFESRWLSWLGPWRFNFAISQMENQREDIDKPLFMAWRVVVMPFKDIELGFSRTAQFCGEQLACDWDVFWNMMAGNDNVGIDATPENEPGNQMAGFDMRWSSPIGSGPYAVYAQYIGEDESSYLPVKYLAQIGIEGWKPTTNGGLAQWFLEYANTTCSALSSSGPYYNCAYNQGRFNVEGYRYRGRVIGHTMDSDAESFALGGTYSAPGGAIWSATARAARLNHDGVDVRNTVSAGPADYAGLEFGWRGKLFGQSVSAELGADYLEPEGGSGELEPYGFIGWRHELAP
jgi:hypothetical protein